MDFTGVHLARWMVCGWLLAGLYADDARAEQGSFTGVGVPEEVLVIGEQPGPGLWKVSKGAHTLWLLGTYVPTPKGMVWRSKQVEAAIAASNEVLGPYSVSLRVKDEQPFLAQKGKLKDVLPRSAYARWRTLRDKYIGESDDTDRLLPTAAALLLQARAYEQSGLTYSDDVWRTIYRIAMESSVPVLPQSYDMEPPSTSQGRSKLSRRNGANYLVATMDRLASDIAQSRARANAWAVGDMAALETLVESDASYAQSMAHSWPFLSEEEVNRLQNDAENKLLSTLNRALKRNQVTFAALPIHLILRRDGLISRMRAFGYSVEPPQ